MRSGTEMSQFLRVFLPTLYEFCDKWSSGFRGYAGNCHTMRVLGQGSNMTLTSCSHKSSCTHLDKSNYQFLGQNFQ